MQHTGISAKGFLFVVVCLLIALLSPLPATIQVGFPVLGRTSTNSNTTYANFTGTLTSGDCVSIDANSNLIDNGTTCAGAAGGLTTKTTTYNIAATDNIVLCNSAVGFTITLPTASVATGKIFRLKNINTGTCTVAVAGGINIDGAATYLLTTQYQAISVAFDGSQYWITGAY